MDESRRERFERLAPGLVEPLRRYLARRTDPDTAEDVLAETLLVCWRRVDDPRLGLALARLRAEDAELLRLWAWEQLSPAEIATVLGITANAASIRLHRARERLRAELRKGERMFGHEGSKEGTP